MTPDSKLIGFIPTRDGDRALSFYRDILGLRFVSDGSFTSLPNSASNETPMMQPQSSRLLEQSFRPIEAS